MAGIFGSVLIDIQAKVANLEAGQKKANAALRKIQREAKQTAKSLKSIDTQAKKTGASINKAFRVSKVIFLAAGALRVFSAIWRTMLEGAESQQTLLAFDSLVKKVGGNTTAVFRKIKEASKGILSETEIRRSSSIAVSLGIPIERIAELMEIAQAKSRDMGTTLSAAFLDVAKGIGRGSRLILDNLGIILRIRQANIDYAKTIGKSVSQLSDYDKRQAILNAVINQGTEALRRYNLEQLTSFEKMQKLANSADDAWKSFTRLASSVFTASIGFSLLQGLFTYFSQQEFLIRGVEEQEEKLQSVREELESIRDTAKLLNIPVGDEVESALLATIEKEKKKLEQLKQQAFSRGLPLKTPPETGDPTALKDLEKELILQNSLFNAEKARAKERSAGFQSRKDEITNLEKIDDMELKRFVQLNENIAALEKMKSLYADTPDDINRINQLLAQMKIQQANLNANEIKRLEQLVEATETAIVGLKLGFRDVGKEIMNSFEIGQKIAEETADAMTTAFEDGFFSLMTGKFRDLEDVARSFLTSMQNMISSILADMLKAKIVSGIGSLLGGVGVPSVGVSGGGTLTGTSFASQIYRPYHSGGMVKRYHGGSGGLAADEVPAILQTGEAVLSRSQVANAGSGGDTNNFTIVAMDSQSFHDFLKKNGGSVASVITNDLKRNGGLRSAIRQSL